MSEERESLDSPSQSRTIKARAHYKDPRRDHEQHVSS
ncbi:PMR5N domain-containing protein [Psidium guajava]|nr:PMR5N domain-containing protein [Psidium guajava]